MRLHVAPMTKEVQLRSSTVVLVDQFGVDIPKRDGYRIVRRQVAIDDRTVLRGYDTGGLQIPVKRAVEEPFRARNPATAVALTFRAVPTEKTLASSNRTVGKAPIFLSW